MKLKRLLQICLLFIFLYVIMEGSKMPIAAEKMKLTESVAEQVDSRTEEWRSQVSNCTEVSEWELDAYQQMTLFIQEGFRKYGIEGKYQVYFGEIGGEERYYCDILLEGEEFAWYEYILYTYDEGKDWYSFEGEYEPIFTKDIDEALEKNDSFAKRMKENYVYKTEITRDTDCYIPIRYYSENGPVESDVSMSFPHEENNGLAYSVRPMIYTYQDERLDVSITIEYPQIYHKDYTLEAVINEKLKEAFFYSYSWDDDNNVLKPSNEMYVDICRQYFITREDERYFSVRIYEDNYFRGASHPNEWETGITIDMQTGEVLLLEDVVGEKWTLESLLDSGAFECLWVWRDSAEQKEEDLESWWIEQVKEENRENTLSDYDSYFYLTDDSLGLITEVARYYTCMEADYEELGLINFVK